MGGDTVAGALPLLKSEVGTSTVPVVQMRKLRLRSKFRGPARPAEILARVPGRCSGCLRPKVWGKGPASVQTPLSTGSNSVCPHIIPRGRHVIIGAISQMREGRPRWVRDVPKDTQLVSAGRGDCSSERPWGLCHRYPHLECLPWVSPSLKLFLSPHLSAGRSANL